MSTPENSYSHPENRITFSSSRMPSSFLTFEPCTEGLNLFVSTAGGRRVMLSFGTPILLMYFPRDAEMTMILFTLWYTKRSSVHIGARRRLYPVILCNTSKAWKTTGFDSNFDDSIVWTPFVGTEYRTTTSHHLAICSKIILNWLPNELSLPIPGTLSMPGLSRRTDDSGSVRCRFGRSLDLVE